MAGQMLRARDLSMGQVYIEDIRVVSTLDANRRQNCARGFPSVMKAKAALRPNARVAIVGYGPSLQETWEQLRDTQDSFDAIWTVSKAHDFLIEDKGVPVTHHTDVDYREHKAKFNRTWWSGVHYMIATQVHPSYLNKFAPPARVSLFHVEQRFGGMFPPGYLRLPVMFDAGLQAAHLAFWLGYREQEWFGMDASARAEGHVHAGPHEGVAHDYVELEIAGKPRLMSALLVRQAFWAEKMLCKWPHMQVKIHGDGALKPFLLERGKCTVS